MNSKERVIAAITHQRPDRVPLNGDFQQDYWPNLENHFGTKDAVEIRDKLGLDIRYSPLEPSASFAERAVPAPQQIFGIGMGRENLGILRDNGWLEDEYGVCRVPDDGGIYWHYRYHPLAEAELEEVKKYQFPDPSLIERYRSIRSDVALWGDSHFTVVELWNIFKSSWELRGFEQYMMDMALEPKLVETLADKILEHRIEQSKQLVRCGIDMIVIMGDIAQQDGMMLSPAMWRNSFKPRLKTWIEEVRREGDVFFMFHSDGDMEAVFGDLVEIGIDVFDPIQPECMDVLEIERRFGSQVCLHGTISLQKTLPFGTPEDVAAEVRQRISCSGQDGGLILAPANIVQNDVSLENILALYTTAKNFSL